MKHIGGRGHKSPYGITKAIRVPIDLIPLVEELSDNYKKTLEVPQINKSEERSHLIDQIKSIKRNIDAGGTGYKERSAGRLIDAIKRIDL